MAIRSDEISDILKQRIANFDAPVVDAHEGVITSVGDGIARIYGLEQAMAGELLEFPAAKGGSALFGLALDLRDVAEVGEEQAPVQVPPADHGEPVGAREPGQIAQVHRMADQQRIQVTLAQPGGDAVAALRTRRGVRSAAARSRADRVLSSEPAEHQHREADRSNVGPGVPDGAHAARTGGAPVRGAPAAAGSRKETRRWPCMRRS